MLFLDMDFFFLTPKKHEKTHIHIIFGKPAAQQLYGPCGPCGRHGRHGEGAGEGAVPAVTVVSSEVMV